MSPLACYAPRASTAGPRLTRSQRNEIRKLTGWLARLLLRQAHAGAPAEVDVALPRAENDAICTQPRPWLPYPEDVSGEREFDVVLENAEEGGFVVSVPDLPGCWTQGETRDEALANAKEAIGAYLDALEELGRPLPKPSREHVKTSA